MFYSTMTGVRDKRQVLYRVTQKCFEICGISVLSLWVVEEVSTMVRALLIYLSINLSTIFT